MHVNFVKKSTHTYITLVIFCWDWNSIILLVLIFILVWWENNKNIPVIQSMLDNVVYIKGMVYYSHLFYKYVHSSVLTMS